MESTPEEDTYHTWYKQTLIVTASEVHNALPWSDHRVVLTFDIFIINTMILLTGVKSLFIPLN